MCIISINKWSIPGLVVFFPNFFHVHNYIKSIDFLQKNDPQIWDVTAFCDDSARLCNILIIWEVLFYVEMNITYTGIILIKIWINRNRTYYPDIVPYLHHNRPNQSSKDGALVSLDMHLPWSDLYYTNLISWNDWTTKEAL